MPPRDRPWDTRLHGAAPVEAVLEGGQKYLTMEGVMARLHVSEDTLRRHHPELMALRIVLAPRVSRWRVEDVDAYMVRLQERQRAASETQQRKTLRRLDQRVKVLRPKLAKRELAQLNEKLRAGVKALEAEC
jgi:hypothetical protein